MSFGQWRVKIGKGDIRPAPPARLARGQVRGTGSWRAAAARRAGKASRLAQRGDFRLERRVRRPAMIWPETEAREAKGRHGRAFEEARFWPAKVFGREPTA